VWQVDLLQHGLTLAETMHNQRGHNKEKNQAMMRQGAS
jgi:hypothetical protein